MFYQRLIDNGKEAKVALIAAILKLLMILTTLLKNQTTLDPVMLLSLDVSDCCCPQTRERLLRIRWG